MNIVEFITARLDEDEVAARAVSVAGRPLEGGSFSWFESDRSVGDKTGYVVAYDVSWDPARKHIVRHDPARILADIAAKRAIVQVCNDFIEGEPDNAWYDGGRPQDLAMQTLRLLASVYADHPDYRQEWRP